MERSVNGNTAYDRYGSLSVSRETAAPARPQVQSRPRLRKLETKVYARHNISPFAITGFVAVIGLMMLVIFSYVQLTEITDQSISLKTQLSQLQNEKVKLLSQYEDATDLSTLKNRAISELGMMSPDTDQIEYINMSQSDKAVIIQKQEQGVSASVFQAIKGSVYYVLEYFS